MRLWCGLQAAPSLIQSEMMKRLIVLVLLASALLTGCNTARGFGEDIKHLGNSISRAAS